MKKLIALLFAMAVIGSIYAQHKTAYLDLYQRGGAQHLRTTLICNQKNIYIGRKNIGETLNRLAELGWEVDKTFNVIRFGITRHKFHIILKKEYRLGENPFDGITNTLNQDNNQDNNFIQKDPVIHIQENVTAIKSSEFYKRKDLREIHIHKNIIKIGNSAFFGCTNITTIYCEPLTPPKVGLGAFQGIPKNVKIYVPQASVDTYKTADSWKKYAAQIVGYDF